MITLDLPAPPSVNKLRRIDWVNHGYARKWRSKANMCVLVAKCRPADPLRLCRIERFELHIMLSEKHTRVDLDNSLKCVIDYLVYIELIADDAQANMRKLTVEWGNATEGCRITLEELP